MATYLPLMGLPDIGRALFSRLNSYKNNRITIVGVVYLSLLLDNILLTMVVPIIPDFLIILDRADEEAVTEESERSVQEENAPTFASDNSRNATAGIAGMEKHELNVDSENGKVGLLLSSKATVQLLLNPVVGMTTAKIGYHLLLLFGTLVLFGSAIAFALGSGYVTLFLARSLQGVASSCIGITGMCLVAEKYPTEPNRSRMMGFVLGSVAIGVLIGYPLGGFLYDSLGKSAPFAVVATLILFDFGAQFCLLDLKCEEEGLNSSTGWVQLFSDKFILLIGGAIGVSTSAMAILEPCLPLWLLKEIKPERWQLGTAFIPDSVGYVIGTNVIGLIAHRLDRCKTAVTSLVLVGISAFLIPMAKTMGQLVIPHFLLGLGIGAVDAALVPMLAALVDARQSGSYVSVYAMQQMAVSLAYSLGPIIGSEMVRVIGFPSLMRIFGLINIFYSPSILILGGFFDKDPNELSRISNCRRKDSMDYRKFPEADDSD